LLSASQKHDADTYTARNQLILLGAANPGTVFKNALIIEEN
jgi:hypothetical protein